jgi:4-carboxymuconolactone decarboxylase
VTAVSIAADDIALTPAALMIGHHISLPACCNVASATVAAAVAIGAFVFRPRRLTVTIGSRSQPARHAVRDHNGNLATRFGRNAAMTESPLRAKGRAMRRNLMGAAYADKLDQQLYTDPIMEKFAAVTQETVFGSLWTRPGLDLKTRTLICVISDTATGRSPELKLHIRFALNHGWTEDELTEAILHLLGYVGAPLVREALLVARETFAEMRAENEVTS